MRIARFTDVFCPQGEKITSLLKAANVKVEPYWPALFAKATSGLDLKAMVTSIGAGVGTGGGGAPAAAAGGAAEAETAGTLTCC